MTEIAEVHFRVPETAATAVAGFLNDEVGSGLERRDGDTLAVPDQGLVELVVWVPQKAVSGHVSAVERFVDSLRDMGTAVDPFTWSEQPCDPDGWVEAYKKHFTLTRIGTRFVVKPSWEEYVPTLREELIEIDPGMAFGTGLHASTRLAMHAIERVDRSPIAPPPQTMIDIGCGTGILAIAATKLWSRCRATAVDTDPTAVEICRDNVARNGTQSRIRVEQRGARDVSGRYDLVLANLSFDVLSESQAKLIKLLSRHGRLILSGLLCDQANELCRLYSRDMEVEPEYTEDDDGWRVLLLRVPSVR